MSATECWGAECQELSDGVLAGTNVGGLVTGAEQQGRCEVTGSQGAELARVRDISGAQGRRAEAATVPSSVQEREAVPTQEYEQLWAPLTQGSPIPTPAVSTAEHCYRRRSGPGGRR